MNQMPNQATATTIRSRFGGKRALMLAGAVAVAVVALALSQNWLSVANLVPLLFVLPCVAMMFMCAKGHHGAHTDDNARGTVKETEHTDRN